MKIELDIPDSLAHVMASQDWVEYRAFLQQMLNRICVGALRYGPPNRRKLYMTRLGKELRAYRNTGNFEQLLNIGNYAFLESLRPQNKKLHFDPTVDSVTRSTME